MLHLLNTMSVVHICDAYQVNDAHFTSESFVAKLLCLFIELWLFEVLKGGDFVESTSAVTIYAPRLFLDFIYLTDFSREVFSNTEQI